jgi:hypothetical protein
MPQAMQIVFDSLFGAVHSTNSKIKLYAVQFVHLIAEKYIRFSKIIIRYFSYCHLYFSCDVTKLSKIGGVLVQGMNKVISEMKDVRNSLIKYINLI